MKENLSNRVSMIKKVKHSIKINYRLYTEYRNLTYNNKLLPSSNPINVFTFFLVGGILRTRIHAFFAYLTI